MNDFGFARFAELDPHAPALIDPAGLTWSRGRLLDAMRRCAQVFADALETGDVVAIAAPNGIEHVAVHLGAIAAGLYVVPLNWHLAEREIAHLLADCGARAIVAHERLGAARCAALREHATRAVLRISIGNAAGYTPLSDVLARPTPPPAIARARGRVLPYTSATTGLPKAVKRPIEGSRLALMKAVEWHRSLGIALEDRNVHLCCSMLYHAAPLEGVTVALEMGHAVVVCERFDAEAALHAIEAHRVTTTFMVPSMFARLLELPNEVRVRYATSSLRFVVHGGAPCSAAVKRRMIEWWGPIVWEAYGACEVQGAISSSEDWLRRPGTVGRAIEGAAIEILDEHGRELPPGEIGLVYVKHYTGETFEYLGDDAKTRAAHHGELVTVGDLGYVDGDGYLFVSGRRAELILSSGMNIYPAEIEHVLIEHRDVADCAVVGMEHARFGEVPRAIVQPAAGVVPGPRLTFELLKFLGGRLAPMKVPHRIDYAAELPRDANGKLRRALLSSVPK